VYETLPGSQVFGAARMGESEVAEVALSTDGGRTWIEAKFLDPVQRLPVIAVGLFGAALTYGDGAVTPAISVLAASRSVKGSRRAGTPVPEQRGIAHALRPPRADPAR
jgi:K+ potassium transporter